MCLSVSSWAYFHSIYCVLYQSVLTCVCVLNSLFLSRAFKCLVYQAIKTFPTVFICLVQPYLFADVSAQFQANLQIVGVGIGVYSSCTEEY